MAVTPDGRHVVSGSDDCTLRVWDLKDRKEILTFTTDGAVTACIAARDNRTIIAGGGFGRLHFLQLVEADKTKPTPTEVKIQLLHPGEQPTKKLQEPPIMLPAQTRAVFISYAHADNQSPDPQKRWLDRFVEFLQPLVRQEDFTLYSDQDIKIGQKLASTHSSAP